MLMATPIRNKRRTKLTAPANSTFSNCVQDHLFAQPLRGSLDQFKPVVYLDEHGRRHGRVSDHLLQRQIESDRVKLKKQSKEKVPPSSTLYGVRNPNIVALVKDVPVDNKDSNDDDDDDDDDNENNPPITSDEVKMIEYKKPSSIRTSATNKRQTSSTSGKQSVRFDSTSFGTMSKLADSHLSGLDDANPVEVDDEEELQSNKPVNIPDKNSQQQVTKSPLNSSDKSSTPKNNDTIKSTNPSRESQRTHMPPSVEDINDVEDQRKSVDRVSSSRATQRQKSSPTSSDKREERIKSSSSRPKTALSSRSRTGTEEGKSSRLSSASSSSINTSALLRSENDSQHLSDEDLNDDDGQMLPVETPVKSEHASSAFNETVEMFDQQPISPEPVNILQLRNAKGEYDASKVLQLRESFQPIINEAASYGHLDVVRELIEGGQSVHTQNLLERTPLHEASASGNHQLVTELLNNGALIDQRDTQGMTALHIAASHGSDINAQDNLGRTPAHYCAMHNHVDAFKYLINAKNIDLTIATNETKLSIHYAAKNGSRSVLNVCFQSKLMIDATDAHGNTIAHEASEYDQLDCVRLIWKNKRNLFTYKNNLGRTPMHMAALFGAANVLHWLLELKIIDIEQADNDGYTMAHLAASRGYGTCFACLLTHNAPLDLYTFDRQESVIDVARRSGKNNQIERARAGIIRCRPCDEKIAKEKYDQTHGRTAVEQLIHTQIQRGYNLSVPPTRSPISISGPNHSST
ncbi:unnamed protein product [Adineta ricciae]|uniref:Uncharacterized protein n=1 Tax=Adineta ricciae TaxID=249248 RepID=A0A815RAW2_ADIRI|nr:unnamed protein product [Adineta ricciae]